MFDVELSSQAKKKLKQLTKIKSRRAIADAIDEIALDPYIGKPLTRELAGRFAYKLGNYRIIYKITKNDRKVGIIKIGHRSDVYN